MTVTYMTSGTNGHISDGHLYDHLYHWSYNVTVTSMTSGTNGVPLTVHVI